MKLSLLLPRVGLAVIGALALTTAAPPGRAETSTPPAPSLVEGVVAAATDPADGSSTGQLVIHPVIGDNVPLTVDGNTKFHSPALDLNFDPAAQPPAGDAGAATQDAVTPPSPTWFVGLYARAYYNGSAAVDVTLTPPQPLFTGGVVVSASDTEVVLNVKGRGELHLTLSAHTSLRLNGRPAKGGKLAAGDLAEAMFWLTDTENDALRVESRFPAPLSFVGLLPAVQVTGPANTFNVTGASQSLNFTVDGNTAIRLDGKKVSLTDLKGGVYVNVLYLARGGVNLALRVTAFTPKPEPKPTPTPTPKPGGDKGKGDKNNGNQNTGDKPKGTDKNTSNPGSRDKPKTDNKGNGDKPKGDKPKGDKPKGDIKPTGDKPKGDNKGNGAKNTGSPNTGDKGKGNDKPVTPQPAYAEGLVAELRGDGFTVKLGDKVLSFAVNASTGFQIEDKPATFAALAVGQHVHVAFVAQAGGKVALKVLIHKQPGSTSEHSAGGGGGAGKTSP
jgi:hypothetical protein